jgi:ADP-ribose pyrophosphatase YjhB (NUDIX family)
MSDARHAPDDDRGMRPGDPDRGLDGRSTDIRSGRGTPPWLAATVRFCSRCGGELVFGPLDGELRHRLICPGCAFISYVNPRLVATTLPITDAGEIVLIRRGIEPAIGAWAQPGGFLEIDETVHEAAVRETVEETGLLVEPGEIIGLYSRLEASVVVLVYEARIVGGAARPSPEATEVVAFRPEAIPWAGIGFRTTYWALVDWLRMRHPDLEPGMPPDRSRWDG